MLKKRIEQALSKRFKNDKGVASSSSSHDDGTMVIQEACVPGSEGPSTLDYACSYHYTSKREWFSSYSLVNDEVILGDNSSCNVASIGTIHFKMKEGAIWKLTNMKHVLDLKKNLISLGYLENQGYNFGRHAKTGILTIAKGQLIIMKGKRTTMKTFKSLNYLYFRMYSFYFLFDECN